ncbi:UPF0307 protein YjgA [hydrothermal vent metagenome]|uniref:UPF0307 protein YjgA n=1 Tax=hydrothermal vent metagenome TaxID=652676 RepID=A0A3B1BDG7_9ZZZZ
MHDEFDEDEPGDDQEEYSVSKSQLKREAHALLDLGKKLVQLDKASLAKIPLPDNILDAVNSARKMHQHGALKRQLQFIGKLMRKTDAEPIQAAYESITDHFRADIQHLHQIETWRDRLITEGDSALGELLSQHPDADRQHLRQLMRSAKKERELNKAPRAARELFQYLKGLMAGKVS